MLRYPLWYLEFTTYHNLITFRDNHFSVDVLRDNHFHLLHFTTYYILLHFTTFYYILLHTTFYYILLHFTTFYHILLHFTTFYYILLHTTFYYIYYLRTGTTETGTMGCDYDFFTIYPVFHLFYRVLSRFRCVFRVFSGPSHSRLSMGRG